MFKFLRNCLTVLPRYCTICHLHCKSMRYLVALCPCQHLLLSVSMPFFYHYCFYFSHFNRHVLVYHHDFNVQFPNGQQCWAFFRGLFGILLFSLVKYLFKFLLIYELGWFFTTELWEFFLYSGYMFFVRYNMIWKYFL